MSEWILIHSFLPDGRIEYQVSDGVDRSYDFDNLTDAELFLEEMRGDE